MSNRNDLIGWIRYDSKGVMIPGTLIYRRKKPAGRFKRLIDPVDPVCCLPNVAKCDTNFWVSEFQWPGGGGPYPYQYLAYGTIALGENCNSYFSFGLEGGSRVGAMVKMDGLGGMLWVKQFEYNPSLFNSSYTIALSTVSDNQGNTINLFSLEYYRVALIIKQASDGSIVWYKTFYTDGSVENTLLTGIYELITNKDGDIYLTGSTLPSAGDYNNQKLYLAKLSGVDGSVLIEKTITPSPVEGWNTSGGYNLNIDSQGNIIANIWGYIPSEGRSNHYYVKVDPSLNIIWSRHATFSSSLNSWEEIIQIDKNDDILIPNYNPHKGIMKLSGVDGSVIYKRTVLVSGQTSQYDRSTLTIDGVTGDIIVQTSQVAAADFPSIPSLSNYEMFYNVAFDSSFSLTPKWATLTTSETRALEAYYGYMLRSYPYNNLKNVGFPYLMGTGVFGNNEGGDFQGLTVTYFKTPLANMGTTSYGIYDFYDITNLITVTDTADMDTEPWVMTSTNVSLLVDAGVTLTFSDNTVLTNTVTNL